MTDYEDVHWADIPQGNLADILYIYEDKYFNELNNMFSQYHQIDKTSYKTAKKRIHLLKQIQNFLNELVPDVKTQYVKNVINKFNAICQSKSQYIQQLCNLKDGEEECLRKRMYSVDSKHHNNPLCVFNEIKFHYPTQEVWGMFIVEAADPCHRRRLTSLYTRWKNTSGIKSDLSDFFFWLEDKELSLYIPRTIILTDSQLSQCECYVKNGLVYYKNNSLVNTKIIKPILDIQDFNIPGHILDPLFSYAQLFTINLNHQMHLIYGGKRYGHVSISQYKPLLGCGSLVVKNGHIVSLSFDSGHYLPQHVHNIQSIKSLEKQGVYLNNNIQVTYYQDFQQYNTTLEKYIDSFSI